MDRTNLNIHYITKSADKLKKLEKLIEELPIKLEYHINPEACDEEIRELQPTDKQNLAAYRQMVVCFDPDDEVDLEIYVDCKNKLENFEVIDLTEAIQPTRKRVLIETIDEQVAVTYTHQGQLRRATFDFWEGIGL